MPGFKHSYVLVAAGFIAGAAVSLTGAALAWTEHAPDPEKAARYAHAKYMVSIDEVKQNFVFAEPFDDSYTHTVTMSDGTQRTIGLRPMMRDGVQVLELSDKVGTGPGKGGITYMGLDSTTTNGKLMISVDDLAAAREKMKAVRQ